MDECKWHKCENMDCVNGYIKEVWELLRKEKNFKEKEMFSGFDDKGANYSKIICDKQKDIPLYNYINICNKLEICFIVRKITEVVNGKRVDSYFVSYKKLDENLNFDMVAKSLKIHRVEVYGDKTKWAGCEEIANAMYICRNGYRKYEKGGGMYLVMLLNIMNFYGYDDVAEFLRVGNDSTPLVA